MLLKHQDRDLHRRPIMGTQESDALLRDMSKFEQRDHLKPIQRQ